MNKNLIIVGVLIILAVVSILQTVQIAAVKANVADLKVSGVSASRTISSSSTGAATSSSGKTNLQSLPGMVGGC